MVTETKSTFLIAALIYVVLGESIFLLKSPQFFVQKHIIFFIAINHISCIFENNSLFHSIDSIRHIVRI